MLYATVIVVAVHVAICTINSCLLLFVALQFL